jgi:hypothetical protein
MLHRKGEVRQGHVSRTRRLSPDMMVILENKLDALVRLHTPWPLVSHERVVDRFIAPFDLLVHKALVIVADFPPGAREHRSHAQEFLHRCRLEDPRLRIN